MSASGCSLFTTPAGVCAIAWGPEGVRALRLPESEPEQTLARIAADTGLAAAEPPADVRAAMDLVARLLAGEKADLRVVRLDLTGVPPFHRRVYEALREVPAGETTGYAQLAARVGSPGAARAVGQAMACNPLPLLVPCHRVLASGGRVGGFSAPGGVATKQRLLALEGVTWSLGKAPAKEAAGARRRRSRTSEAQPELVGLRRSAGG